MSNPNQCIHAISGWGIDSHIFDVGDLDYFSFNYFQRKDTSLEQIATSLAANMLDNGILLGWSLGGLIAIQLAHLFPKKVKKLILIASQPKFLADNDWSGIHCEMADQFVKNIQHDFNQFMLNFVSLVNYPSRNLIFKKKLIENLQLSDEVRLLYLLNILFETDLRKEYQSLNCDILHLIGNKDVILRQDPSHLRKLNPHVKIKTLNGVGHAGFLTHSKIYQAAIQEFIQSE